MSANTNISVSLNNILNYKSSTLSIGEGEEKIYKKLHSVRYFLSIYLSQPGFIGGEIYFLYKNKGALLDFKNSNFENIKNVKTNFLIKPLNIHGDINHASLLLLDVNSKTFSYFDPNGTPPWYNDILKGIFSFMKFYAPDYKYSPAACIGLQTSAVCADWTVLYIYLKSLHPELTLKQITVEILKIHDKLKLHLLLDNWQKYLWDITQKFRFQDFFIADILMLSRLSPEEYVKVTTGEYHALASKDIDKAKSIYRNALRMDSGLQEYFNDLINKL